MRRKKTEKKQFYIGDIFRVIGLIIAFSVLLYPTVSNYLYEKNGSKVISAYDENAVRLSESDKREMLEAARQYNEELLGNIELLDPFSSIKKEVDERYQSLLNVNGSGMIGYIRIPKINAELPIYHGTEEKVLQSGVGHFEGTSLPIGGESTHAVLTGHRGLPSKLLFTDLDNLEKGDIFYIKVLGETFAYQVDQILTVLPENTKELTIVPGKDYVTLVTCTPYAVNTHRLLVRGYRIPYEEAVEKVPDEKIAIGLPFQMKVLFIGLFILFLILFFCGVAAYVKKRKKKREKTRREDHVSNDGKWTLAGDFGNAGVSLEGIESSEKNEQAKQLYNYAVRQSIQGNALKTDENGIAMIGGLEQGLYLIAQTKVWTDEKQGSYQASPYLISIPEEIDGSYIWDVVTKPKSEWITEAPQHPEMPDKNTETEKTEGAKTGDTSSAALSLLLLIFSSGAFIILCRKRRIYRKD